MEHFDTGLADGYVDAENVICGLHNNVYQLDTGVSEYNNQEVLPKFTAWVDREQDAVVDLMKILARACGHNGLSQFTPRDLTTWKKETAELTGIRYAGV